MKSLRLLMWGALACALSLTEGPVSAQDQSDNYWLQAYHRQVLQLYQAGQYSEAARKAEQYVAAARQSYGEEHQQYAIAISWLAFVLRAHGRYAEAEQLYQRALTVAEKSLGHDDPLVATTLNNLAGLYHSQGRYAEAEPLYRRSGAIREKTFGPDHPELASTFNNLGELYRSQNRYAEAEPLYQRALAIVEKTLGPDHPYLSSSMNNLALVYQAQGRYAEAEPLYRRSFAITEKLSGPDHPEMATALNNLALFYSAQDRYAEAEPLYQRALAIRNAALGPDHSEVASSLHNLAAIHFQQHDWKNAAMYWRQSTDVLIRRSRRGVESIGAALTGKNKSEVEHQRHLFWGLIKATYRLAELDKVQLADEMFKTAQWAQRSDAAASLAQMAARQAKGDNALGQLIRERQDLVGEWQTRDKTLVSAKTQSSDRRNAAAETALAARLATIDARILEIDRTLAKHFPDYAELARPEPVGIGDVQGMLNTDEALLLFLDTPDWRPTPEESFIWIVSRTDARWLRADIGTNALMENVAALRCGLDLSAWDNEGASRCSGLLKAAYEPENVKTGKPLPFDFVRAHNLYRVLFGQIEELIKDKHLLIVPSGPLTALPIQVLVAEKPSAAVLTDPAEYAGAAWLAKRHAITVLPSVSSLKALREFAKASKASEPFIGFGNPLLTGPDGKDRRAWDRQSCKATSPAMQIASRRVRSALPKFFRSGLADVDEVRAQTPLPETADELCAVAHASGASKEKVYLGDKATETTIKALSADGSLSRARIVHFATHGLLAGETEMLAVSKSEPALLLTPPEKATEDDDGLLTASEVAQLKLDADWVVLSACNTAAGESDKPGAEALSGLARAFFYAGARALLVSHWAVNSEATVHLITKAFGELKANPKIGRGEALRRSMVALIAKGGVYAHPTNWAPFVVVGEGAAR